MTLTEAGPPAGGTSASQPATGEILLTAAPLSTDADSHIRDVLAPLGPQIRAAEGVEAVLQLLTHTGAAYVAVTDDGGAPLGLITRGDIDQLKLTNPDHWSDMRCGNVIVPPARFLQPYSSFDDAVETLRDDGVRPLLVLDAGEMVGVLAPSAVFQWCAAHRPAALEELAQLAGPAQAPVR